MNRAFTSLDRFYTKAKDKVTLAHNAMNLYKELYFNPLKDDIYKELNNLIKQDKNGNTESRNKIKSIMRILKDIDMKKPRAFNKENPHIIVLSPEKNSFYDKKEEEYTYYYQNEWYEKYFKDETIQFAKEKVQKEITSKSVYEYILSILKYLEEEKEREKEYINEIFHDKINKINYQYLLENAEELVKMNNGIAFMFENRKKDELQKVYELFKLYEPSLNILKEAFKSYIETKCEEIKAKGKDSTELNNFKNDVENLIIESFENNILFQNEKEKILLNN